MILMSNAMMGAAGHQSGGGADPYNFRYLRLQINSVSGVDTYVQLLNVEVINSDDGLNLAAGATVTSSGSFLASFPPSNLINYEVIGESRWIGYQSDLPGIDLLFSLGSQVSANTVKLTQWGFAAASRTPKSIDIQVSTDGIVFNTAASIVTSPSFASEANPFGAISEVFTW